MHPCPKRATPTFGGGGAQHNRIQNPDDPAAIKTLLNGVKARILSLQTEIGSLQSNKDRYREIVGQLQQVEKQDKALQSDEDDVQNLALMRLGQTTASIRPVRPTRPNFVFIMVDDLGWGDLGVYGSRVIQTPNLDRMAANGMRFTDAYSGHTICAPSRWALMLGQHTGHTRVRANSSRPLLPSEVTIAEVLKKAGYATGGFGKWGMGTVGSAGAPEQQGFDTFFGYYHHVHAHTYYPPFLIQNSVLFPLHGNARIYGLTPAQYSTTKSAYAAYEKRSPAGPFVPRRTTEGEYQFSHDLVFDRTKRFIRENRNRPFFCYAPWTVPHGPYHIPADEPALRIYRDKPWSKAAKVHAAFVSMLDRHVGEILQLLQDLDIAESTVVFFMSDNGPQKRRAGELDSAGLLRGEKKSMHDGGIRSPLLVHWPGRIAAGVVSGHVTYNPDMLPTLAELSGREDLVPSEVDGLSIAPTLLGNPDDQDRHQFLYWEGENHRAARQNQWKLVSKKPGTWQVFDLERDISESNNVAINHQDLIDALENWLRNNRTPPG